jgi:hypothetical protein
MSKSYENINKRLVKLLFFCFKIRSYGFFKISKNLLIKRKIVIASLYKNTFKAII